MGICAHSATGALVRPGTDVRKRMPGEQSALQFIPRAFSGVEVRALHGPLKLFNYKLGKSCF